jgi:hypothetical protein
MLAGFRWWSALVALTWLLFAGCSVEGDRAPDLTGGNARTLSFDGAAGPGIMTDKASYTASETVNVSWIDMPGGGGDWISISPVGSGATVTTRWQYTGGAAAGSAGFTLSAGTYEARAYVDNGYSIVATSAPFTVTGGGGGGASIASDKSSYAFAETVNIAWSGLPGNAYDWISIAPVGSGPTVTTRWQYTAGATSGTAGFTLPGGTYEARAYVNDSYTVIATSASFTVSGGNTTLTPDRASYMRSESAVIAFQNMEGSNWDWISIAPAGSAPTTTSGWTYTGGASGVSYAATSSLFVMGEGGVVARRVRRRERVSDSVRRCWSWRARR